jgi:hypothetical protein
VCLVFEEAHSLVPEWSSAANEGDKSATNRTSRAILQGRKYGLGCLLITQRTANVTKTILNQCNTIFAMRTFDDTGKAFLANYIGSEYSSKLSSLQARHAVYYGKSSSCENPVLLRLNDQKDFQKVFRAKFKPKTFNLSTNNQDGGLKKKVEPLKITKLDSSSKKDIELVVEPKEEVLKNVTDKPLISKKVIPERIESKPNLEQKNDLKIGYQINHLFKQAEPYKYPIVKMPIKDSFLKLPRNGRSGQKGYKESDFYKLIQSKIPEIDKNVDFHLSIPFFNRPYEPDIVLFDESINLYIDIEIDEPYDGYYRYPTHVEGKDNTRDLFFTESGWIIIRFTEKQVHEKAYQCIDFIKDVLNTIYKKTEIKKSILVEDETQWDNQQAILWEQEYYREKYLGIDEFGKILNTTELIVDPSEMDPVEKNIKRTENFKVDNKNDIVSFDEDTHTYRHPKDTTGNASFISVTTLIDRFFPFDLDSFIQKKAATDKISKEIVLEEFLKTSEEAAGKGTNLHEQIENFLEGKTFNNDTKEFKYFIDFYEQIIVSKGFKFVEAEKKIVSKEYNVSGTIDALFKKSDSNDYIIIDWKRSKKLVVDGHPKKYGYGFGLSELNHLDNSSYYKYSLQQNMYKYILEYSEGLKVSSMKLVVFHPNYSKYYLIPLPDMPKEVEIILESTKHKT